MQYQNLIDQLVTAAQNILKERLTGVYLHGSLAMGCFHPEKSDIDLIVVIRERIFDEQKMRLMERIVDLNRTAPEKGLEISVIKQEYCRPFVYPTPYELHFSPMHLQWFRDDPQGYVANMHGEDTDLAAHVTILRRFGRALCGEPVERVFGEVPQENYIDSICKDIAHAGTDILDNPVYVILNLCRTEAFLRDGLCVSKKAGAEWALANLPQEYHALIREALTCYTQGLSMQPKKEAAVRFASGMLRRIRKHTHL